jgi:hypothetical protein
VTDERSAAKWALMLDGVLSGGYPPLTGYSGQSAISLSKLEKLRV